MTLEQRDKLRRSLAIALVLVVGVTVLFRKKLAPMAEELLTTQVDNQASDAINEAIAERIADGEITYDQIITVEKNAQGAVTAMQTNITEVNRLKTDILKSIDAKLENLSVEELGVPIGSVILPELFSGKGPKIPVRVLAVRTSDAIFHSNFESAGINQTLHSIYIDIHVVVTILTWTGTQEIAVDASVVAAETVIVGSVPATYFGMEELP